MILNYLDMTNWTMRSLQLDQDDEYMLSDEIVGELFPKAVLGSEISHKRQALIDFLNENNIICSVVTNKPHATAEKLCEIYFGGKLVKCIGDIIGIPRKPDPTKILGVMNEFDVDEAIYVGDSDVDVKSARNANIPCISVSWGFRDRDFLIENGADILVDNASELCKEILKIFSLPHLQNKFDEVMK